MNTLLNDRILKKVLALSIILLLLGGPLFDSVRATEQNINIESYFSNVVNDSLKSVTEEVYKPENIKLEGGSSIFSIKDGDHQTIFAGESATVSVRLEGDLNGNNPHDVIRITVHPKSNLKRTVDGPHYVYNPQLNEPISFTWFTDNSTPPGDYIIRFHYPATPTFDDEFEIKVIERKEVVLFVPGFMGTEIYSTLALPMNNKIWPSIDPISYPYLALDENGTSSTSYFGNVFREYAVPIVEDIDNGKKLLKSLEDENVHVIEVPYDWRMDLKLASLEIATKVEEALLISGGQKITIISHSTGALPVKKYLLDNPNAKVKNWINMAGANLGSPRSMQGLVIGDNLGVDTMSSRTAKNLVQNMTSVYQLLPSNKLINIYRSIYGNDLPYDSFYQDLTDSAKNTTGHITNYTQTQNYIKQNHNAGLYNIAVPFRENLENRNISSNINEFRFVGYGFTTAMQITKYNKKNGLFGTRNEKYKVIWGRGDGVIPLKSADGNREGNAKVYYYEGKNHMKILTDDGVISRIKDIILNDANPSSNDSNIYLKGHGISIDCPVYVTVYDDQGNVAYFNEEGFIVNQIDKLSFLVLGESKVLFVPDELNVTFEIEGYDEGYMDLSFGRYDGEVPSGSKALQRVKISNETKIHFTMNNVTNASKIDIFYDELGDGNVTLLRPDVDLTLREMLDVIAPETSIVLGGVSQNHWFSSDVNVSFSSIDEGDSGVIGTYYSINDAPFEEYEGQITLTDEGIYNVKYFSYDKAGNIEMDQEDIVRIDKTPPTTPHIHASTTEWTREDVVFTIDSGIDELSGVEKTQYKIGENGSWIDYLSEVTVNEEGEIPIFARTLDVAGNISDQATVTVKIDKTPPEPPAHLTYVKKGFNSLYLKWPEAYDNVGVTEYEIYQGSTLIGMTEDTSFFVENLTMNEFHYFHVRARDAVGHVSEPSNTLKVWLSDMYITSSYSYNFAIKSDGTVWGWGANSKSELGEGTFTDKLEAEIIPTLSDFVEISAGGNHNLALAPDGTVWAWGDNQSGQLGNTSVLNYSNTPVQVTNLDSVISISAGLAHSVALKEDGTVWSWGANLKGQLGEGEVFGHPTPKQIPNFYDVVAISAGETHTIALKSDGTVWAWGDNSFGQLGNGNNDDQFSPVKVKELESVIMVSTRRTDNLALKNDGTVWAWGMDKVRYTDYPYYKTIPEPVDGLNSIIKVSAGDLHNLALSEEGSVWTWGDNKIGSLGDGSLISSASPVRVSHLNSVNNISAGWSHSVVSRKDGSIWSWGNNLSGQLGNGTKEDKKTRTLVLGTPILPDNDIPTAPQNLEVVGKTSTSVVLQWEESQDNFAVEGYEIYLDNIKVGITTVNNVTSYEATRFTVTGLSPNTIYEFKVKSKDMAGNISLDSNIIIETTEDAPLLSIGGGGNHSLAVNQDGTVWAWGDSSYGQMGDGYRRQSNIPIQSVNLESITKVVGGGNHSLALKSDGTVWVWGDNSYGQLGTPTQMHVQFSPIQNSFLSSVVDIASGEYHSLALKDDGTVWSWGNNFYGQLGDGTYETRLSPVKIQGLNNIVSIQAGSSSMHSLALDINGNVWAWGDNTYGQLGNSNVSDSNIPVKVLGLSNVKQLAAGASHNIALSTDGSVWSWGNNVHGQLGNGTTIDSFSPVKVSNLNVITDITAGAAHNVVLDNRGIAWSWGMNIRGELGDGNTYASAMIPVQVNFGKIISINSGNSHTLAIDEQGRLWTWGYNQYGQLGNGSREFIHPLPVKVQEF